MVLPGLLSDYEAKRGTVEGYRYTVLILDSFYMRRFDIFVITIKRVSVVVLHSSKSTLQYLF